MIKTVFSENLVDTKDVRLANRSELFCILSFLEGQLPDFSPTHFFVLAAICSRNPSYKVYFKKDYASNHDSYLAILCVKEESMIDSEQKLQKCWLLSSWDGSDKQLLHKLYDGMDEVNWNRDCIVSYGYGYSPNPNVLKHIEDNYFVKFIPDDGSPCLQYFFPFNEALNLQLSIPREVYVKSLERTHASIVYDKWVYNYSTTINHIADEIDQLPSAGVFLKENDELISWMMSHPPTGMSRLYTLDNHRRKGYAKLLTCYLSKRLAQTGYLPFVTITPGNTTSIRFFESLGFRLLHNRYYVYFSLPPSFSMRNQH